jgi:hypothetical protein
MDGIAYEPRQLGISGGYLQTSTMFHRSGPSSIPIVAEICIGLEVRIFTEKRMAHKWVT